MEQSLTKKILKVCAASLLAVSSFSYSSPAPYQLSPLENYLIKSFAWEQYESFVNTGASTLFENPKVYYFSAGSLAKNVLKNPTEFIQKYKGQKVFVEGVLSRYSPSKSTFVFDASDNKFVINIRMGEDHNTETHPSLRKNFYCQVANAKKNEIILDNCITGLDYQKVKIGEIEQGIKDFLSGKDKTNPNMPTYAMLAYMALVSAKLLPTHSCCQAAAIEDGPQTTADIRACNQEVTTLWQNNSQFENFNEAMDSVERDLMRHGADLNMVRKAASLMD